MAQQLCLDGVGSAEIRGVAVHLHAHQHSGAVYSAQFRNTKNDELIVSERFNERNMHTRGMQLFSVLLLPPRLFSSIESRTTV